MIPAVSLLGATLFLRGHLEMLKTFLITTTVGRGNAIGIQ